MGSINKVILIGRLGKDPEGRVTQNGTAVANFSIATSRKKQGEEITTWHDCTVWESNANFATEFLKKGDQVFIEGEIYHDKWVAKDGTNRTSTKINVYKLQGLGGGNRNEAFGAG